MAKVLPLNTTTAYLSELIGNGKIYHIPQYQRDYSWNQEHWEDLWNDILELYKTPEITPYHYMGSLVVQPQSIKEYEIIDGQQRLSTLNIIAIAIIYKINELIEKNIEAEENQERKRILEDTFLGAKNPASLTYIRKLVLNANNDYFYENHLLRIKKPISLQTQKKTNQLLWKAFEYFCKKLDELPFIENGALLASFLTEVIASKLLFILIQVEDEVNAYTVFETLNARGIELSATDLLKNYFFSLLHNSADFNFGKRKWDNIINTVQPENFPDFLRYFLSLSLKGVRHKNLFKSTRSLIRHKEDVFLLLDELEEYAELFIALGDSEHEFWQEQKDNQQYIKELNLFGMRQVFPVLFAASKKFDNNDFTRLLKLVVRISFRYSVISKLNPNKFQDTYNQVAVCIFNEEIKTPRDTFELLRPVYVSDEDFKLKFKQLDIPTKGKNRKLVRYILYKIEQYLSGIQRDFEIDRGTIEHILPENPIDNWVESFKNDEQNYTYRLGNLTILEPNLNRDIGNSSYEIKKEKYAESNYHITKTIDYTVWTSSAINTRQELLAKYAAHIWRIDFD